MSGRTRLSRTTETCPLEERRRCPTDARQDVQRKHEARLLREGHACHAVVAFTCYGKAAGLRGGNERETDEERGYTKRDFIRRFSHEAHLRLVYLSVTTRPVKPPLYVAARLYGLP